MVNAGGLAEWTLFQGRPQTSTRIPRAVMERSVYVMHMAHVTYSQFSQTSWLRGVVTTTTLDSEWCRSPSWMMS